MCCASHCRKVERTRARHEEARVARGDLSVATLTSHRKILDAIWRPAIGPLPFLGIRHSLLVRVVDHHRWSTKTYNNSISALRRAFELGFRDHPEKHNPALTLKSARISRKDRSRIDPFTVQDAERLIAAIHRNWGEVQGNYDEFRFFTGLRPSEQMALRVTDFDAAHGLLSVTKACVNSLQKDCTKTRDDRVVVLNPRAIEVLQRQLALLERMRSAGLVDHDFLFVDSSGQPIAFVRDASIRWRQTLRGLPIRYRRPYTARHTCVSWHLMTGSNPLWVAKQHGTACSRCCGSMRRGRRRRARPRGMRFARRCAYPIGKIRRLT